MERKKKYLTEEERKEAHREYQRRSYEKHKENRVECSKKYYQEHKEERKKYRDFHKEEIKERDAKYRETIIGNTKKLLNNYIHNDRKSMLIGGELPSNYITIEEFISLRKKGCTHCEENYWRNIGLNRLNNSLPHTIDNVEPCCLECNKNLWYDEKRKSVYQYTLDGELVKVWSSTIECGRNGYNRCHIVSCCNGKRKSHKGFKWSYEPIL